MSPTIDFEKFDQAPRLLAEVKLKPVQGHRFQPTGFADLGPARYALPDAAHTEMLLVESVQSVANRMESACWDYARGDLLEELGGLPFVRVVRSEDRRELTNSILEAHRLNSPYILEGADRSVLDQIRQDTADLTTGPVDLRRLARLTFKYDPNAVIHGIFLARSDLAGGRLRLPRLLSGFIEASDVRPAESGGVKNDRVDPGGDTSKGFGNVPFHRTEFVAKEIKAYFNLDLALLRGYGLPEDATKLLITLSLFKVRRFLSTGLRLRTACDLETASELTVTRPTGLPIPSEALLLRECTSLISRCKKSGCFADPPVTEITWQPAPRSRAKQRSDENNVVNADDPDDKSGENEG